MGSFSEQDPLDPDDPELDYTPLRLRERAEKLGRSVSQGARSEPISSSPISRPASLDPKAINEPARRTRDLDRRAALSSVAARVAAVAGVVAVVALLFVIMKPASRQSVASSTPSDVTDRRAPLRLSPTKEMSDKSPRSQSSRRSSRHRLASLLLTSNPSSCFSAFCNGMKKPTRPKHLNSGPTNFVEGCPFWSASRTQLGHRTIPLCARTGRHAILCRRLMDALN